MIFGIFLTPVFYFVLERLGSLLLGEPQPEVAVEPVISEPNHHS